MRKFFQKFFVIICIIFLSGPSYAFEGRSTKQVLDSGLTVLVAEMPSSSMVSVYALVKTGAATEGKFLGTGITHFLEHMLFKGTHDRGVGELAARVQSVGGSINASTGFDYTVYTVTVPYESFDVALSILADMMMNATMDAEEIERERDVVFSEMRMRNDDPDRKIGELTFKTLYTQHPYQYPIIGYKTLLAQLERDDFLEYYKTFYVPNNMILSIAGQADAAVVIPKVKEAFKDFARQSPVVRNLPQEPPQISPRFYEEEYPTDLTRLTMSFLSVRLLDPDLYALDVLAKVLGQGRSSRLYLNVYKDKGLVHSISSSNYTPMDKGLFGIRCLLEQENADEAVEAIWDEIKAVKAQGITPDELAKAKQQVRAEHILGRQTSSSVAYAQGLDEALTGDRYFSEKYVEGIERVSLEDVRRVARAYLVDSALTTAVLKPEAKEDIEKEDEKPVQEEVIRKEVLENGLTVLLKEDHTFPIIAVELVANGGVRQETAELNGLCSMMASAWTKGTKKYTANEIAQKTEELGISLSSFSGRNSFGLNAELLKEHWPTVLEMLEELITAPTFPDPEIEKIKKNMKVAIREREDSIFHATAHALKRTLFLTHPFRLEQEGTVESIDRITRDDLKEYYEHFSAPNNMVLSVFGDIDPEKVLRDIKKRFGNLKDKKVVLRSYTEEPPEEQRQETLVMDKEQAMVMFGFQGVTLDDQDRYGLEVLTEILGSAFNGRLFMNIREELGGAYTLGGNLIPGPDVGMVYFYVLTAKEKVNKVKGLVQDEIRKMQSELVSEQELSATTTYLKGTFKASRETNSSLAFITGLDELYGLGFDYYKQYDERVDAVTSEDIRRIARHYLDLNKAVVVITNPQDKP